MQNLKVCLVGCGSWGKNLARNFHALGALYGLCDSSPAALGLARLYPQARTYAEFHEVLEDPAVDAAVIATPAETHARLALAALEAGKDVFVEKPIALDCGDARRMVQAARARGKILMVGHLLRYHPAVRKLQDMLGEGLLGKIEYIYSNRLNMGKIRREENALWSFAPHDISVILALVGESPLQVTATGGAYLQPNIADVTLSSLLFDRGVRAHIFVSWLHPYKEQRLVVIGSQGMAVFEDTRPEHKLLLFDRRVVQTPGGLDAAKPEGAPVPFDSEEPLRNECRHFLDCLRTRRQPVTSAEEGLRVLEVLQACQRSLQMNGQVVTVDFLSAQKLLHL